MDFKELLKKLVASVKLKGQKNGKPWRNQDIAKVLGYSRSYFQTLIGENGNVTEDHVLDFNLRFDEYIDPELKFQTGVEIVNNHHTNIPGEGFVDGRYTPNEIKAILETENEPDYREKYILLLEKQNEINSGEALRILKENQALLQAIQLHLFQGSPKSKEHSDMPALNK